MKLIEEHLSAEKIENSQHYKDYCTVMGNYQNGYDYLKSKDDGIRSIDRISVIPKSVYDSNLKVICDALEVLKSKIIDAGIQGKLTEQLPEDGTAEELLEQIAEEKKQLII